MVRVTESVQAAVGQNFCARRQLEILLDTSLVVSSAHVLLHKQSGASKAFSVSF